jgi:DNA mismatch repair protein MutL
VEPARALVGVLVSTIRRLPPEIANRIAAGEVVERPASVGKELLENALDAGAERVELTFDGGGIDRIRVSDDGSGIAPDEVALAFERHATSKIRGPEDLERIATLGFRGEALASIAAVSNVEMTTATEGAGAGTRLRLEGGRVVSIERAPRARGTTIEITRLFHNTPARRKFLKAPSTESRLLVRLASHVFLGALSAGLRVVREGRNVLAIEPSARFPERVAAVYGEDTVRRMVAVDGERDGIAVHGIVALGDFARTRGERQVLLVNGRPVADASLAHAVLAGIGGAIPSGRFPIFALALTIDPSRIDVNVHPTKREIRFAERDRVYGAIRETVARAASSVRFDAVARVLDAAPAPRPTRPARAGVIRFGLPDDVPPATGLGREPGRPRDARLLRFSPAATEEIASESASDEAVPGEAAFEETQEPVLEGARLRLIGEAWGAYLLVEDRERILVLDQHAAHERVLYDEIRARQRNAEPIVAQGLLVPLPVDLGPGHEPLEACELLRSMGFEARPGGPRSVFIEAIPGTLTRWGGGDFLREFFTSPESARASAESLQDALAKSYSCRMAVKFGQKLHAEEIRHLLDGLARTDVPRVCPHGRPIFLEIGRGTVDAKFERT